jgi:hypothetical protein
MYISRLRIKNFTEKIHNTGNFRNFVLVEYNDYCL